MTVATAFFAASAPPIAADASKTPTGYTLLPANEKKYEPVRELVMGEPGASGNERADEGLRVRGFGVQAKTYAWSCVSS